MHAGEGNKRGRYREGAELPLKGGCLAGCRTSQKVGKGQRQGILQWSAMARQSCGLNCGAGWGDAPPTLVACARVRGGAFPAPTYGAVSLKSSRPMMMRRISLVPAPISYCSGRRRSEGRHGMHGGGCERAEMVQPTLPQGRNQAGLRCAQRVLTSLASRRYRPVGYSLMYLNKKGRRKAWAVGQAGKQAATGSLSPAAAPASAAPAAPSVPPAPVAAQDLDGIQRHAGGGLGSIQDHRGAVLAVRAACRAR